jgi:hypothetical protein
MPIGYYRFLGIIKSTILHYSRGGYGRRNRHVDGTHHVEVVSGYFEVPDYSQLVNLPEHKRKELLRRLAEIICGAYDTEWWYTLLQRATFLKKKTHWNLPGGRSYPGELKHFPRTVDEYLEWSTLQGGRSFVTTDQAFNYGQAAITTKSKLTEIVIKDMTDSLPVNSISRWTRSITRHLAHFSIEEIGRIEDAAPEDQKRLWSIGLFQEILAERFENFRRKPGDTSSAIVWPTNTGEKMIRWRNFGPKILKVSQNMMPTRDVQRAARAGPDPPKRRDIFFKALSIRAPGDSRATIPQLNNIILVRCLLCIERKSPKRTSGGKKKNNFPIFWSRFKIHETKYLNFFWDSIEKMNNAAAEVFKKLHDGSHEGQYSDVRPAALVNETLWRWREEGEIDLFQYEPIDTQLVKDGMTANRNHAAFIRAQKGYITRDFFNLLVELRTEFMARREAGTNDHSTADLQYMAKIDGVLEDV